MKEKMNFKKVLTVAGLASFAFVGLASCGSDKDPVDDPTPNPDDTTATTLNLALSYNNIAYIKYNRNKTTHSPSMPAVYTTLDGMKLYEGTTLLPVWQKMEKHLNIKIEDAAVTAKNTATMMENTITANYEGLDNKKVDVLQVMNGNANYVSAVTAGDFLNLSTYKDQLPNLFAFLEKNPAVYNQMLMSTGVNRGIYYAPYFDGQDQLEKCFNMNVEMVRALLDDDASSANNNFVKASDFDSAATLATTAYTTPYIDSMTEQEIAVAKKDGDAYVQDTITVSFSSAENIINIQNALATKSGKNLTQALRDYIDNVYGDYIGEGNIYASRSEIFTSASACYNADELVALLRCIKTNPAYLTGSASTVMVPFFPRTGENNRVRAFIEIGQMFGLRGSMSGEKDLLWYNEDGELVDGRTQEYTYKVLDKMRTFQEEGLFPATWLYDTTDATVEFRKNLMADGRGFMCYDYSNVTAFNESTVKNGTKTNEMEPVIAPVAKWPITKDNNGDPIVGANTDEGYSYTRFSEDNRSLKDGGWSIVAKNVKGNAKKLAASLKLLDYMYTNEGSFLECYGTEITQEGEGTDLSYTADGYYSNEIVKDADGVWYPILTDAYKAEILTYGGGTWHNYMTKYQGACLGVGNIRSNYLEAQNTNPLQEVGMKKIANAIATGAMFQVKTSGDAFFRSVPTSVSLTEKNSSTITTATSALVAFWNINKNATTSAGEGPCLDVIRVGWANLGGSIKSYDDVEKLFASADSSYLKYNALSIGVPAASGNQYKYYSFLK